MSDAEALSGSAEGSECSRDEGEAAPESASRSTATTHPSADGTDAADLHSGRAGDDAPAAPTDDVLPTSVDADLTPEDAFGALGNEVRLAILAAVLDSDVDPSFSDLFEATDVDTTAGFAYHLRQLTPAYLRDTGDGYVFTSAGATVARAVAAGTLTDSVDREPVSVEGPCPFCGGSLAAETVDNVLAVACLDCERSLVSLSFPPAGYRAHGENLPAAFERHHRHRLSVSADGVCPECGGVVDVSPTGPDRPHADLPPEKRDPVQFHVTCETCGYELATPATPALLTHPAVVSFYHDHGIDVRERPIWSVGSEWRETLVSADPWVLRVSTPLDGETLSLYVDRTLKVQESRRQDQQAS